MLVFWSVMIKSCMCWVGFWKKKKIHVLNVIVDLCQSTILIDKMLICNCIMILMLVLIPILLLAVVNLEQSDAELLISGLNEN